MLILILRFLFIYESILQGNYSLFFREMHGPIVFRVECEDLEIIVADNCNVDVSVPVGMVPFPESKSHDDDFTSSLKHFFFFSSLATYTKHKSKTQNSNLE